MKELAIGEEIRIRCVEDTNDMLTPCSDCIFIQIDCPALLGGSPCNKLARKDGKNVHFELVED